MFSIEVNFSDIAIFQWNIKVTIFSVKFKLCVEYLIACIYNVGKSGKNVLEGIEPTLDMLYIFF